jgi:hypothetical protein
MKKVYLIIALQHLAIGLMAQFNETIRTGRPGQAIGPFAVGKNVFQSQTGFDVGGFNEDKNKFSSDYFAPNTVLRYGLAKHYEINTGWEYRRDRYNISDSSFSESGISASNIGTRINLYEGKNHIPALGIQLSVKLPILADAYNPRYAAPRILLIASERITDRIAFLLNVGMNFNGNNAKPGGVYVANLSYAISSKWGTYIESYGNFDDKLFEVRWDTGLAYLLNDNIQLDIYGGLGNNQGRIDYFGSLGISIRLVTLRTKMFEGIE